jgi:SAM-dependent methyltransferase
MVTRLNRLRATFHRYTGSIGQAYRGGGIVPALRAAQDLVAATVKYRVFTYREWRFDRTFGIDTRGGSPTDVESAPSSLHHDSLSYAPSEPRDFAPLVNSLPLAGPPTGYTFIDLGCGKGRVLVLAADYGFGRVVGVELDARLVAGARANLRSLQERGRRWGGVVEVVHADAAAYPFPPEPSVVYLYNPFGEQTLRVMVKNLVESWNERPRPLIVVYYNPVHQHLLDEVPILRRVPSGAEFWSFFEAVT